MFLLIDRKPEIETKFLRPAPWLSAIISINSILLQAALLEGLSVAWWYNVERYGRTTQGLKALNKTWRQGTSFFAVIRSWKAFNYVALATVFVATIPIEGFLLQSSISQYYDQKLNHTTLHLPVLSSLPFGFTAEVDDGTIQPSADFMSVQSTMDGQTKLPIGTFNTAAISQFDWIGCENRNHTGICKTNVTIPGFNLTCTTSTQPYDMRPGQHSNQSSFTERVFSSGISFNVTNPNVIVLDILYKPNQTCNGNFYRKTCELRVAKMSFPVQVSSDQTFYAGTDFDNSDSAFAVLSIDATAAVTNITYVDKIEEYPDEGNSTSTYGAVAKWLQGKYNGTIDWTYNGHSWASIGTNLGSSFRLVPCFYSLNATTEIVDSQTFRPSRTNASWCENVYDGLDWVTSTAGLYASGGSSCSLFPDDIVDTIFLAANRLMLGASLAAATVKWNNESGIYPYAGYPDDYDFSNVTFETPTPAELSKKWSAMWPGHAANQTQAGLHYRIRYGFYGGSVGVTLVVILMILPLYYGYWHLDEIKTLEPRDTATVFMDQKSTSSYESIEPPVNEKARGDVTITEAGPSSTSQTKQHRTDV